MRRLVKGLRARGGYEVGLEWKDAKLVQAVVRGVSNSSGACTVWYGQKTKTLEVPRGGEKRLTASDLQRAGFRVRYFDGSGRVAAASRR